MYYDKNFLNKLVRQHNRSTYARITLLEYDTEKPIEDIEGRIIDGSISIDGNSAVRRTCSLTLTVEKMDSSGYLWGLHNKFKLEIGINNNIDSNRPSIIWFSFGIFIFTEYSTNTSTNNFQISVKGQDKMCLLNGTIGGKLSGIGYRFDVEEIEDSTGAIITKKIPVKTIIREAVHRFANEPYQNIIINDIDDYAYNIIRSHLDGRTWAFIPQKDDRLACQIFSESDLSIDEISLTNSNGLPDQTFRSWVSEASNYWYNKNGFYCNKGETAPIVFYPVHSSYTSNNPDLNGRNPYVLRLLSDGPEQLVGYDCQELVYPTELTANVGETLTSLLDKIKKILVDFEYFYDVQGRFVFQRKRTYVTRPFSREVKDGVGESYILPAAINDEVAYSFDDQELVVSFSDSPKLSNIKNDFSVWGADENKNPFLYRFAIDSKPIKYTTITVSEKEAQQYKEKFYPLDTDIQLKAQNSITFDTRTPLRSTNGNTYVPLDWREIIYQMAQDQYKWGRLGDFEARVAAANPDTCPLGKTKYEQYYIDILGLWRKVYNPWYFLEIQDDGTLKRCLEQVTESYKDDDGKKKTRIRFRHPKTKEFISLEKQAEVENYNWIVLDSETNQSTRATSCFLKNLDKTPFWFEVSDSDGSVIDKFAVHRIGDRAEVIKEDNIKFMFPLNVPQMVFYRNNTVPQGRFGGTPYRSLVSDENFYGGFFDSPTINFTNSVVTSKELKEIKTAEEKLFKDWKLNILGKDRTDNNCLLFKFNEYQKVLQNEEAKDEKFVEKRNEYLTSQNKVLDQILQYGQLILRFNSVISAISTRFQSLVNRAEKDEDLKAGFTAYRNTLKAENRNIFNEEDMLEYFEQTPKTINSYLSALIGDTVTNDGMRGLLEVYIDVENSNLNPDNYILFYDNVKTRIGKMEKNELKKLEDELTSVADRFTNFYNTKSYNTILFLSLDFTSSQKELSNLTKELKAIPDQYNALKDKLIYLNNNITNQLDSDILANGVVYDSAYQLVSTTFNSILNKIEEFCQAYNDRQSKLIKEYNTKKEAYDTWTAKDEAYKNWIQKLRQYDFYQAYKAYPGDDATEEEKNIWITTYVVITGQKEAVIENGKKPLSGWETFQASPGDAPEGVTGDCPPDPGDTPPDSADMTPNKAFDLLLDGSNKADMWKQIRDAALKITGQSLTYQDIIDIRSTFYTNGNSIKVQTLNGDFYNYDFTFNPKYDFRYSQGETENTFWYCKPKDAEKPLPFFVQLSGLTTDFNITNEWVKDITSRLNQIYNIVFAYDYTKKNQVSWFQAMIQRYSDKENHNILHLLGYDEKEIVKDENGNETEQFKTSFRITNLSSPIFDCLNDLKKVFSDYDSKITNIKKKFNEIATLLPQSTSYNFEELVEKMKIKDWDDIKQDIDLITGFNISNTRFTDIEVKMYSEALTKILNNNNTKITKIKDWFVKNFQTNSNLYDIDAAVQPKTSTITVDGMFEKVSGQVSAKEKIDEMITKYSYSGATVSLTTVPIYHLESNTRISISNKVTRTSNEYLLTQMTIPLSHKGTMTISATLAPPSSLKEE